MGREWPDLLKLLHSWFLDQDVQFPFVFQVARHGFGIGTVSPENIGPPGSLYGPTGVLIDNETGKTGSMP